MKPNRYRAALLIPAVTLVAACTATLPNLAHATSALQRIKNQGSITIGVKPDSKPWGFRNPSGQLIGMGIDLAHNVADQLGVKLKLVATESSNRIPFLQKGKIDLVLATMYDTPTRRRVVDMVLPHYYAVGANILALKSRHFTEWTQLAGKKVCGQQGSQYNRWLAQNYHADIFALPTIPTAYAALRAGNCVAFVYNSALLKMAAANTKVWGKYEVPLESKDLNYFAIGVKKGEGDGPLGKKMSHIVKCWHKTGKLIELNKKWGLPGSPFLQKAHEKYKDVQCSK